MEVEELGLLVNTIVAEESDWSILEQKKLKEEKTEQS